MPKRTSLIPAERVEGAILAIRGDRVLLDRDLAELYGVETRTLIQAVKRNLARFPADFMFQLTREEFENWRSQIVMSNPALKMSLRRRPYAFTEQGVAMLWGPPQQSAGRRGQHRHHADLRAAAADDARQS